MTSSARGGVTASPTQNAFLKPDVISFRVENAELEISLGDPLREGCHQGRLAAIRRPTNQRAPAVGPQKDLRARVATYP
jgi:hypothetical protein